MDKSESLVDFNLLLLQLKRPVRLGHGFQYLGIVFKEFVVDLPKADDKLLSARASTAIVAYVQSKNITRKSIAMEVHGRSDLRTSKPNAIGPLRHGILRSISDMACQKVSFPMGEASQSCMFHLLNV